ncbi:flagellar biosynthesis anti-sigma factor FlgM [Criibacterium bergeronii]|uniref:Negative regulator of flagellin synthesis n=1 Tax=Criibacterium bergeronii TaxID=1871336 RepID=A0A371IK58_9FIRM|nr:flagellar biosynthesis anti-sigma factor FlgM [Criibacterium bergeronii]MBS6062873.1 flagellar biosynthesis anti-sigma factor FlgM [Peptostreptococcaceae bacterium]RDY20877.1 flagellar biosynthesis anti-sigma factor FlgM [Criibacterium bergeronii]
MKVSSTSSVNGIYNTYKKSAVSQSTSPAASGFDVQISKTAMDFSVAMDKLKNLEPIRTGKVENIKNQISNGSYVVDSSKIARAMLLGEIND